MGALLIFYPLRKKVLSAPVPAALISRRLRGWVVPHELKSKEEFEKMVGSATEVRVTRRGDEAKVKLRTKTGLYTFKTTSEDADSLVKGAKAPVVEF